jgi:hypothetical protein
VSRIAREHPDDPEAWAAPIRFASSEPVRCCSHDVPHYRDRSGRLTCGVAMCGCRGDAIRRHPSGKATPARFDERYDPSPEPIDRRTR